MFGYQNCKLCTQTTLSQSEQLILYRNRRKEFRPFFLEKINSLIWFIIFLLLISNRQLVKVDMLFSVCSGNLSDEVDILDCLNYLFYT